MTKELQALAWSVLPKEFKEEVKFEYHRVATKASKEEYDLGFMHAHEGMFGSHNLTSDAEGEEMLTVSRKRPQECFHFHNGHCSFAVKEINLPNGETIYYAKCDPYCEYFTPKTEKQ